MPKCSNTKMRSRCKSSRRKAADDCPNFKPAPLLSSDTRTTTRPREKGNKSSADSLTGLVNSFLDKSVRVVNNSLKDAFERGLIAGAEAASRIELCNSLESQCSLERDSSQKNRRERFQSQSTRHHPYSRYKSKVKPKRRNAISYTSCSSTPCTFIQSTYYEGNPEPSLIASSVSNITDSNFNVNHVGVCPSQSNSPSTSKLSLVPFPLLPNNE